RRSVAPGPPAAVVVVLDLLGQHRSAPVAPHDHLDVVVPVTLEPHHHLGARSPDHVVGAVAGVRAPPPQLGRATGAADRAADAAGGQPGSGDRGDRPRRRGGDRPGAGRGRGRLPGQAVRGRAARRADPGGAAPRGGPRWASGPAAGGRPRHRHRRTYGHCRRSRGGADAARVRPVALPGGTRRSGGGQARAARRGVAPAVRRGGQDGRRAPVVAAAQARRDRAGPALPAHGARGRGAARGGRRHRRPGRHRQPRRSPGGRWMSGVRAQLAALVAATTSVVLLAFLVPLGLLLRSEAEKAAISAATLRTQSLAALVALDPDGAAAQLGTSTADGQVVSVFLPDGRVLGADVPPTPSVSLAMRGRAFTAAWEGGVKVLVPVHGLPDGTAVVRSYIPEPLLRRGVART